MINELQQKGSTTWILIVLLVIAIVLAICFYTQKRIIETQRDNLVADIQSSKQTTASIETSQRELETIKQEKTELLQQLTIANDSIANLQKQLLDAQNKPKSAPKKNVPSSAKKTTKKPSTKSTKKK
jgi:uncharacterized protein HemX